jgi:3-dehydroquinate synthase
VEIKSDVVTSDTHERGRRKILNFGHTLGHAVEQVSGYALLHGEAVAIGMVLEARLAERIGIAERGTADSIERVVTRAGLPTHVPASLASDDILRATRLDKKARAGAVEYALPERVGVMANANRGWAEPVNDALVLSVLEAGA